MASIGIRREDKHEWEARVPLTPDAVRALVDLGIEVRVQPSTIRAFDDASYVAAGARVTEDLSGVGAVLAVKEVPIALLEPGGAYVFFSHTIKGQKQNMPLLRKLCELGCTLIDYEKIVDDQGRRLVFFGRHAGLAGMIDTLHVLGQRLAVLGMPSSLSEVKMAHQYDSLAEAEEALRAVGSRFPREPLPAAIAPLIVGFAGYGNVSRGAQHIMQLLPTEPISPDALGALAARENPPRDRLFSVVFEERHLVAPQEPGASFDLQEYYDHPERYRSVFEQHLVNLSVLINAIFWTDKYPRLVRKAFLREHLSRLRLLAIGDISCDIDGAVECTVKATTPGAPAYVYDPLTDSVRDGVAGSGIVMMTTDTLPCELPRESSTAFTEALMPFVPSLAALGELDALPAPIRRATIVWRGQLTPEFRYLQRFLSLQ